MRRTRVISLCCAFAVVPVGLLARSYRDGADSATIVGFLASYLGDTLWPIMFFFLARFVWPIASWRVLAFGTLTLTLTLEFGQLWKPPLLQWLREQPGIGFVLGNSFVWSDVVCIAVGTLFAVGFDVVMIQISDSSE